MKSRYIHYYCQIRHDTTLGDHIIPTTITRLGRGTSRDTMFVWNSGDNMTSNIPTIITRLGTSRDTIQRLLGVVGIM